MGKEGGGRRGREGSEVRRRRERPLLGVASVGPVKGGRGACAPRGCQTPLRLQRAPQFRGRRHCRGRSGGADVGKAEARSLPRWPPVPGTRCGRVSRSRWTARRAQAEARGTQAEGTRPTRGRAAGETAPSSVGLCYRSQKRSGQATGHSSILLEYHFRKTWSHCHIFGDHCLNCSFKGGFVLAENGARRPQSGTFIKERHIAEENVNYILINSLSFAQYQVRFPEPF